MKSSGHISVPCVEVRTNLFSLGVSNSWSLIYEKMNHIIHLKNESYKIGRVHSKLLYEVELIIGGFKYRHLLLYRSYNYLFLVSISQIIRPLKIMVIGTYVSTDIKLISINILILFACRNHDKKYLVSWNILSKNDIHFDMSSFNL